MDTAFDLLAIQYEALREEIMEKMKLSHQLGYYKLIALGAMLGAVIIKGVNPIYLNSLFLSAMLLPVVFDAALYFNGKAIIRVGTYIRTHLEPNFKKCVAVDEGFMLWEEYIVTEVPNSYNRHRLWWNLFEVVQPAITISLQLIVFYNLLSNGSLWPAALGCLTIAFEAFLILAIIRK